jgi:hypothetical protein
MHVISFVVEYFQGPSIVNYQGPLRMMAYDIQTDHVDDYLEMSGSQIIKCVKRFEVAMVVVFGPKFLREPTARDSVVGAEHNT